MLVTERNEHGYTYSTLKFLKTPHEDSEQEGHTMFMGLTVSRELVLGYEIELCTFLKEKGGYERPCHSQRKATSRPCQINISPAFWGIRGAVYDFFHIKQECANFQVLLMQNKKAT